MKTKIQNKNKNFIAKNIGKKKFDNKNYEVKFSKRDKILKQNFRRKKYDHPLETRRLNEEREIEKVHRLLGGPPCGVGLCGQRA